MSWWNAIPMVGKVVEGLFGLIDKSIEDKDQALQLKAQIEQVLRSNELDKFRSQLEAQAGIIVAEAKGQSWLQRNWRPGLMAMFGLIIFNNYILNPWLSAMFTIDIVMEIPPDMWALLKLGVGGYVVGRSGEKIANVLVKKEG